MEAVKRTKPLLKSVLQALKPYEVIEDNFIIKVIIISMTQQNEFTISELIKFFVKELNKFNELIQRLNLKIDNQYIKDIVDRFEEKGILNFDGNKYRLTEEYKAFLNEFFGFVHATTIRTGILRFILQSKKRILLWAVINIDKSSYSIKEIESVIGKSFNPKLYNIYKKYGIYRDGNKFIINNKDETCEKILNDILRDYYDWQFMRTRGQIKEFITELMLKYKEISGKEIIDELKLKGGEFDKTLVYYYLRKLKDKRYIEITRIADSKGREKYYRLKPEAIERPSKEELLNRLKQLLNRLGIREGENYEGFIQEVSNRISDNNLPELYTFCEQLDILRYDVSLELWRLLIEYLRDEFKGKETIISELIDTYKVNEK